MRFVGGPRPLAFGNDPSGGILLLHSLATAVDSLGENQWPPLAARSAFLSFVWLVRLAVNLSCAADASAFQVQKQRQAWTLAAFLSPEYALDASLLGCGNQRAARPRASLTPLSDFLRQWSDPVRPKLILGN